METNGSSAVKGSLLLHLFHMQDLLQVVDAGGAAEGQEIHGGILHQGDEQHHDPGSAWKSGGRKSKGNTVRRYQRCALNPGD